MEALVAALAERLAARDIPLQADPKRSIFRIYRDTRFAKDKSPYKTNLGASFPWLRIGPTASRSIAEGMAHANGGYFNFQPGEMYVGGGMWMPEKARLDAFRRAVVDEPDRVRAALEEPGFVAAFGSVSAHEHLKRVPPGFPPDHPKADLLRYKDVVFGRPCPTTRSCRHRSRTRWPTRTLPACRSSASSTRSRPEHPGHGRGPRLPLCRRGPRHRANHSGGSSR